MTSKNALVFLFLLALLSFFGCVSLDGSVLSFGGSSEASNCSSNFECASGVCDFFKQDLGKCAPLNCSAGDQAQGLSDVAFYCDEAGKWKAIKAISASCSHDYECFKKTCKDSPLCNAGDYLYYCKNSVCVEEQQANECERQGLKRIVRKEEYLDLDACIETLAQRAILTTCSACGDGVCDEELEFKCNCPEDCVG